MTPWTKLKNAINIVVGLAIVCGVVIGLYAVIRKTIFGVLGLETNIAAAIVAASAMAFVSVLTAVYTQHKTKEREIAESHRPQKIELYKHFMDKAVVRVFLHTGEHSDKSIDDKDFQKEIVDFYFKFTGDVIAWGSPQVIKTYIAFRASTSADHNFIILRLDDMLRAMREDLGNCNKGLKRGDLMGLFLKDTQELKNLVATEMNTN